MDMNNIMIQILVAVLFVGYTGYYTYKSYQVYQGHKKELEKFQISHKHIEEYDESKKWTVISTIMAIFALLSAAFAHKLGTPDGQLFYYRIAYVALAIMFIGLALETYARKKVFFAEDGFFFVNQYYRYRMLMNVQERKSFGVFRNAEMLMANKDKLSMSGKMADQIKEREAQWKEKKKQKKHR